MQLNSFSFFVHQVEVLTKGDNNRVDDRGLYAPGQLWLKREDILGRARGTLRYLGMVTIILNDYPVLKYVLIGKQKYFIIALLFWFVFADLFFMPILQGSWGCLF